MCRARDVMTAGLLTISQDATVEEAIRMLIDRDISGAPVVDDDGKLAGIISELQLLEAVYTPEVKSQRLRSFMTKDVLTVTEDTLLSDVTNILVLHRIRRVPVLRDGRLVGIITRRDLLRYALEASDTLTMSVKELKTFVGA